MPDLAILDELRADLDAAFARAETRRRRRRWALPAGGLALASTAAAAVALLSASTPAPATAAEALRQVAEVAAAAPAPVPRDDQYYYVKSRAAWLSMFAGVDPHQEHAVKLIDRERAIWLSVSRPGRMHERRLETKPIAPGKEGPDAALPGGGRVDPTHGYSVGGEQLSRKQLLAYPTDPQAIIERLRAHDNGGGNSREGNLFEAVASALREQPAPPALRAGFYGALALIEGVELAGAATDRAGRAGTAVAFTEIGIRNELIFDPETSELLGTREVLLDPAKAEINAPAGTVIGDVAYLERAVVDEITR